MIYYTADLHFHYALLLPSRPFATVEEMDEALVKNWSDTVGPEDTVYLVGDPHPPVPLSHAVPQAGLHDPRTPPPRTRPGL